MQQKVDVISNAYSQMRISGLTVQPTPEDLEIALTRLEDMMAELEVRNIDVQYNFEEDPDPSSLTNVERGAWQMMATNLAIRLIPDFNKVVPPALVSQANQSMSTISALCGRKFVREVNYPRRQARGSGNTLRYNRWQRFYRDPANAPSSSTTNFVKPGDINDYVESYSAYLNNLEEIDTFTIDSDPDLTIVSSSNDTDEVSYRIEVSDNPTNTTTGFQRVIIEVLTTDGRVENRQINFDIQI